MAGAGGRAEKAGMPELRLCIATGMRRGIQGPAGVLALPERQDAGLVTRALPEELALLHVLSSRDRPATFREHRSGPAGIITRRPFPFSFSHFISFRRPTSWLATPCNSGCLDHSPNLFSKARLGGAFHC